MTTPNPVPPEVRGEKCCAKCFNRDITILGKDICGETTCFGRNCPCHNPPQKESEHDFNCPQSLGDVDPAKHPCTCKTPPSEKIVDGIRHKKWCKLLNSCSPVCDCGSSGKLSNFADPDIVREAIHGANEDQRKLVASPAVGYTHHTSPHDPVCEQAKQARLATLARVRERLALGKYAYDAYVVNTDEKVVLLSDILALLDEIEGKA